MVAGHLATFERTTTRRLTHGALHTENILAKRNGEICVVDLGESIGMSSPLQDLQVLLSSHDGWSIGTGNRRQREAILAGYGGLDGRDIEELRYWEFRHCVKSLENHLTVGADPDYIQHLIGRTRELVSGTSRLPVA